MEFRKELTQAAFALMNKQRAELTKLEGIIDTARNGNKKAPEEWIVCSWELEVNLLRNNIDNLQKQIETQNFDW